MKCNLFHQVYSQILAISSLVSQILCCPIKVDATNLEFRKIKPDSTFITGPRFDGTLAKHDQSNRNGQVNVSQAAGAY